jgi:energy-coupling factor transporter transmembrane protein EcfT
MILYKLHPAAKSSCFFIYVVFVFFHTNTQQIIVGGIMLLYII